MLTPFNRIIELAAYAYGSGEHFDSGTINVFPIKVRMICLLAVLAAEPV